jgi:hypothetical protein
MYFAQINSSNIVIQVIVADQDFVNTQPGTWVQTDISGMSPINYAGIGYTWNSTLGGFIAPQPFPSWTLNNANCQWSPPTSYPMDGGVYYWDEPSLSWKVFTH